MYLLNNAGKSVVAERFIKTLKTKIYFMIIHLKAGLIKKI